MSDSTRAWECDRCLDVGFCYEERDAHEYVRRCDCRRGFDATDPEDRLYACRIPPLFRSSTLGNFMPRREALRNALDETLAYCEDFPHGGKDKGLGLLFWGAKGAGKTHLAVAALMELVANKSVNGRFWDFGNLLKEMGRCYDKSSYTTDMTTLRSALEADVLLLDDLASRRMPDWGFNTLFEIIDTRYRERRPTLITTVYEDVGPEQAKEVDARRKQEYLIERVGRRVRSRLLEMCLFIPMQDEAEREAQRKAHPPSTLNGLRRREKQ